MKKILIAIVAVGFMFCMASCSKECTCKYEVLGISTEMTVKPDSGKCSDMNGNLTVNGSRVADSKCTPKLF